MAMRTSPTLGSLGKGPCSCSHCIPNSYFSLKMSKPDDALAPSSSSPAAIPAVKTKVVSLSDPYLLRLPTIALFSMAATSTTSTSKPSRADIAKLFQNPLSPSSQPPSDIILSFHPALQFTPHILPSCAQPPPDTSSLFPLALQFTLTSSPAWRLGLLSFLMLVFVTCNTNFVEEYSYFSTEYMSFPYK
ncbi:hypothetical protein BD769DRAFT_1663493 [Suillus cothurnatus]|nr:hypothetical protein BD769DRAFT_1663493 [Suillus cothurnatus]